MRFEWDPKKNIANIKKHGFSFIDAADVFRDPNALYIQDPDHSIDEDRWIVLGQMKSVDIIVVVFVDRSKDDVDIIRLISARKATKSEMSEYISRLKMD